MTVRGFGSYSQLFKRLRCEILASFCLPSFLTATDLWAEAPQLKPVNATVSSSNTSPAKVSKKGRNRRHRRLKVRRPLRPMPPLSEAPFAADVPLLPVIEQAKTLLEKEKVTYSPASRRQPSRREIKLALADFRTGKIQVVSGIESNQKFSLSDPGFTYRVDWWNGFNSSITFLEPSHTAVVAMLYALDPDRQKFLRQDAIIYCPYSSALLQTELVEAGKTCLMEKIVRARRELESVPSRAFHGVSLASAEGLSD